MFNVSTLNRVNPFQSSLYHKFFLVVFGNFLLIAASKITIPLLPVPVTMQTAAVLLISMVYGWRLGGITVLAYLTEGLMGLPVFAGPTAGVFVFFGPTGGYLVGFLFAALITGYLSERGLGASRLGALITGLVGIIVIYAFGASFLAKFFGFSAAISLGVKPFLLIDLIKVILLAVIVPYAWSNKNQKI